MKIENIEELREKLYEKLRDKGYTREKIKNDIPEYINVSIIKKSKKKSSTFESHEIIYTWRPIESGKIICDVIKEKIKP